MRATTAIVVILARHLAIDLSRLGQCCWEYGFASRLQKTKQKDKEKPKETEKGIFIDKTSKKHLLDADKK